MTHDLFGKLKYKERDEQWIGYVPLPKFAAIGVRPLEGPPTEEEAETMIADMNLAMENMKNLIREKFGDKAEAAFEQLERETAELEQKAEVQPNEPPDPWEEERDRKRAERAAKHVERLAKGRFPIGIGAAPEDEPGAKQEAAFRFLTENEQIVYNAVLARVWESFQNAYGQEHWRLIAGIKPAKSIAALAGRFAITRLEITREARGGFAHLVFHVDSDWQDEHGLLIVYSPDTREAAWTTWDGLYDLTESDEPGEEYIPTPHNELLEAILSGNEARARELIAAGADINDLGEGEYPPLWIAVEEMEVEAVRCLLAFEADPSLTDPDENTTPLKHAKKLYREMGFAPSKKKDALRDSILSMARELGGKQFDEMKQRLDEIIVLLEAETKK